MYRKPLAKNLKATYFFQMSSAVIDKASKGKDLELLLRGDWRAYCLTAN